MLYLARLIVPLVLSLGISGMPAVPDITIDTPVERRSVPPKKREEGGTIPWRNNYRLNWNDFLCAPARNTDAVASTSTALGIAYQIKNGKFTYQITCRFSKLKSWGLVKTPYILAHEQGHFDITEIFARKLHQALKNYTFNRATFKDDINAIYDAVIEGKEAFQLAYDKSTDNSRNRRKQEEWLQRIDFLLQDTRPYAEYP